MKPIFATLAPLALLTTLSAPAFAEETYPATVGGTVTVQAVAPKPAEGPGKPPTSETLTIHFVHPSAAADEGEDPEQHDLEACGAKWNAKLKAYREQLAQTKDYRTYFDKWRDFPAQRPPQLPLPVLTRASYRACMAECLHEGGAVCPGGWPEETK